MEIRQIQYFLSVAKYQNFTAAAEELNVSQSTLSRQISSMEKELNLLLFIRDNRNVKLTRCGQYLFDEYEKLYSTYSQITQNAQDIFKGYSGNLKFGILEEFTLEGLIQDTLHQYHQNFTNQTIDMKRGSFGDLTNGILNMSYDFIITFLFDISNIPVLKYRIIDKAKDGILISCRNKLSKLTEFRPELFKEETFIILSKDDSDFASIGAIEYCKSNGFYPKIKLAPNLSTAMLCVEAGMGIAFTYTNSIATHNPSMKFIPLQENDSITESTLVLAWNVQNSNPVIKNFLDCFSKCKSL